MTEQTSGSDRPPVALVAGASRGVGLAIAAELGRAGYRVVITARTVEDLRRASDRLTAESITVLTRVHDVRDAAGARDLVAGIEADHGPIEVLVAVAGILRVGPAPQAAEDFDESIDIMLRGPIAMVQAVLPSMQRRGRGRIGVVTSIAGVIPTPHLTPYTAAKFGAVGYSRALAAELHRSPVTVTTIIPGMMRTGGHWNAEYVGRPEQEYAWFATLSSVPIVSIDAARAARIIVRGVLDGRSTVFLTPLARLADLARRISPRTVDAMIGWAGRLLPAPGDGRSPGFRADERQRSTLVRRLTTIGRRAAERFNQFGAHGGDRP